MRGSENNVDTIIKESKRLVIILLFLFMLINFWKLNSPDFQFDSEDLVITPIVLAQRNISIDGHFILGRIILPQSDERFNSSYIYRGDYNLDENFEKTQYKSQIGLQGHIFYFLSKFIPKPVAVFKLGCCIFLTVILLCICIELYKKYGLIYSGCFYMISATSPWIKNFAPNLYWVEFTWFIPMLLGLICLNNFNKRFIIYPLIYLSILIKCACGYEYITVIMLSSIMFLLIEGILVFKSDRKKSILIFKTIITIGFISLFAFFTALMIHAWLRGDGELVNGIYDIYKNDVQRRTFGNANDFPSRYESSLNAGIFTVLYKYLFLEVSGVTSFFLIILSIGIFILKAKRKISDKQEFLLFIVTMASCISWFVLAKSHSYVHTHMNYVMWYMGFIQTGSYIILKFLLQHLLKIGVLSKLRKAISFELR